MSPNSRAAFAYQSAASDARANGSNSVELVVMLYDGLVESLGLILVELAKGRSKDIATGRAISRHVSRALTVTAGLRETLDFRRGEAVARSLFEFYNDISLGLLNFQRTKNPLVIKRLKEVVQEVGDAWRQAGNLPSNTTRSPNIPQTRGASLTPPLSSSAAAVQSTDPVGSTASEGVNSTSARRSRSTVRNSVAVIA